MRSNEKFTQRAEYAIEKAGAAAGNMGHSYVGTEHLLLGILLEDSGVGARVLRRRGITESALRKAITSLDGTGAPSAPEHRLTLRAKQAFERAAAEAEALGQNYIGTEHLLLGILRQSSCGGVRILDELGTDINDIYSDIMDVFGNPSSHGRAQTGTAHGSLRRAETKILDQYSRDLTEMAMCGKIDPVVGRRYAAAARRTIPCSSASLGSARRRWPRGLRCRSRAGRLRRSWPESASSRSTFRPCWRGRNTAVTLRSA